MKYLQIVNDGEISSLALTLMGASTKRDDRSIGFFGSGNKYAIATLLRNQVPFRVFSGLTEITFDIEEVDFRNQRFSTVLINGERTGITTDTGPKWAVRDAIREFWSNALDEGGAEINFSTSDPKPEANKTTILIERTKEVISTIADWNRLFISDSEEPIFETHCGSIYDRSGGTGLFRRGVWICDALSHDQLFSYDMPMIDLPESRKISQTACMYDIMKILSQCNSEFIAKKLLTTAKDAFEILILYRYVPMSERIEIVKTMAKVTGKTYVGIYDRRANVAPEFDADVYWTNETLFTILKAVMPSVHDKKRLPYNTIPASAASTAIVKEQLVALQTCGIDIDYDWSMAAFNSPSILAMADFNKNLILLSEAALENPTTLRKALLEEYIHLKTKCLDHTLEQQHAYLDLACMLIGHLLEGN